MRRVMGAAGDPERRGGHDPEQKSDEKSPFLVIFAGKLPGPRLCFPPLRLQLQLAVGGVDFGRCYYFQQLVVMVIKQLPAAGVRVCFAAVRPFERDFQPGGQFAPPECGEIRFVTATLPSSWWCRFCWTDWWAETQPKCFRRPRAIFSSLSCCVRTAVYMSHIRPDIWFLVSFCGVTQCSQLTGPWPEHLSHSQAVSEASLLSTCSKTCQLSSVFSQCSVKCGMTGTAEV